MGFLITGLLMVDQEAFADTILIFEPTPVDDVEVSQDYGDNVAAASQGGFDYGDTDGTFTPNVVVSYGPGKVFTFDDVYGDLKKIIFSLEGDPGNNGRIDVTLTADAGFDVLLHSFDMAGWDRTDYVINNVQVFQNDDVAPIFIQNNVPIEGDAIGPGHSTFIFNPPLQAQKLRISVDSDNLGNKADNIGMDNIRFSQKAGAAPSPSTARFRRRPCWRLYTASPPLPRNPSPGTSLAFSVDTSVPLQTRPCG